MPEIEEGKEADIDIRRRMILKKSEAKTEKKGLTWEEEKQMLIDRSAIRQDYEKKFPSEVKCRVHWDKYMAENYPLLFQRFEETYKERLESMKQIVKNIKNEQT